MFLWAEPKEELYSPNGSEEEARNILLITESSCKPEGLLLIRVVMIHAEAIMHQGDENLKPIKLFSDESPINTNLFVLSQHYA